MIRGLGFSRGPTSIEVYRKLDPAYDPDHPEMNPFIDDAGEGDVNSFMDHIAMDAKTAKKAIEEDKKEREEEKRLQREETLKKQEGKKTKKENTSTQKPTTSTKPKPPTTKQTIASLPTTKTPTGPKEWIDEK